MKHAPRGPWTWSMDQKTRSIEHAQTPIHTWLHTHRRAGQDPVSASLHAYWQAIMFSPKTIKVQVDFTAFEGNFAPLERCYNAIACKLKGESPIPPRLNIVVSTVRLMRFWKLAMDKWCKISLKRLNFFDIVFRPILKLRGLGGDVWGALEKGNTCHVQVVQNFQ